MKRITCILFGLLALLVAPTATWAQAVSPAGLLSNTTLSGRIDSTQTTLVLASASASSGSTFGAPAAGQCLYIDLELMTIVSMSSTTATVRRGTLNRAPHANAAIIVTGPCNQFRQANPTTLASGNNDCTQYVLPWINVVTGDSWWCDLQRPQDNVAGGGWSVTNTIMRNGTAGSRRVAQ